MGRRSTFIAAALFGIGLAVVVTVVTGWLAALPVPVAIVRSFDHQSTMLFVFTSLAFIDLPVMMLSLAVGLIVFRALGRATTSLVLICAAPWVLYCSYDMVRAFTGIAVSARSGLLFSLLTWSSIFTVPAGLFLAALFFSGRPTGYRFERSAGASAMNQGESR